MLLQCRLSQRTLTSSARSGLRWPKDFELINGTQCLARKKLPIVDGISIRNSVCTVSIKSLSSTHAWLFRWFFACATTLEPLLLRLLSAAMPAMWGTFKQWNRNVPGCGAEEDKDDEEEGRGGGRDTRPAGPLLFPRLMHRLPSHTRHPALSCCMRCLHLGEFRHLEPHPEPQDGSGTVSPPGSRRSRTWRTQRWLHNGLGREPTLTRTVRIFVDSEMQKHGKSLLYRWTFGQKCLELH